MSDDDVRYYEERARQEFLAAEQAENETAASAHQLLALEYEAHAKSLRGDVAAPTRHDRGRSRAIT